MTNTRAGAAAWTQTRAGAVEQVGGDGRPARLSHEAAWRLTRAGAMGVWPTHRRRKSLRRALGALWATREA